MTIVNRQSVGEGAPPIQVTNKTIAQFIVAQQQMNERLQESNDQINARLQALLVVSSNVSLTPQPSSREQSPQPPAGVRPKHSTTHPKEFTGEDESLYPIFRGLLEAKIQTDNTTIGNEYDIT